MNRGQVAASVPFSVAALVGEDRCPPHPSPLPEERVRSRAIFEIVTVHWPHAALLGVSGASNIRAKEYLS